MFDSVWQVTWQDMPWWRRFGCRLCGRRFRLRWSISDRRGLEEVGRRLLGGVASHAVMMPLTISGGNQGLKKNENRV